MKNKLLIIYIVLFLGIAALPFYGMLFYKNDETIGNEDQIEKPVLQEDGKFNVSILSDAGNYFEKKMAFRDVMISAQTRISSDVFHESANDQVIVGNNGWLYYADSLDDYQGVNLLSERALYNIAYNLHRMQEYVERQGGTFVFTVAPNKNSLYPENMPYYNRARYSDEKNIKNLLPYLEKFDVNYADLFSAFENEEEVLYHATDSHWNNKGAALAYDQILSAIGKEHDTYEDVEYTEKEDFIGDLEEMLHPKDQKAEAEIYYDKEFSYTYVNEVESTFDPLIYTENADAKGKLLMYRDSFGNALVPFMADVYKTAEFSRAEPYYLSGDYESQKADTVIVEHAERFIHNLGENPAVIESEKMMMDQGFETDSDKTTLTVGESIEPYAVLEGVLDPALAEDAEGIFLRIDGKYGYEASPMTTEDGNDYGYRCYLTEDQLPFDEASVEVLAVKESGTYILGRYNVSVNDGSVKSYTPDEKAYIVTEEEGYKELGEKAEDSVQYHIFNRTGKTITELYVEEAEAKDFGGENLLGNKKIKDDEEFILNCAKITDKDKIGEYWIKVKYKDGSEGTFKNMSLKNVTYFDLYQSGKKYSYIKYQNDKTLKIKSNKAAVKERVAAEEEAARKAKEEAERKAREEAARKAAAAKAAAAKKSSSKSRSGGKKVVRKEKVYDCDGSGNYYYIYHYSDGSTSTG